ncbi:uncharacterized protein LOC111499643 isoform X2 [Cucurbita maxima]|uniref:Uncharacterized protein LOC111499643 isoform X2 n=1 Tax=Cucurbita maxima TaxID=3661 RepID=A0A6J1L3U2_CUCMA|nr:uncharacterized protein LOC111499643 isoform X2 [Cucurbita maxima]
MIATNGGHNLTDEDIPAKFLDGKFTGNNHFGARVNWVCRDGKCFSQGKEEEFDRIHPTVKPSRPFPRCALEGVKVCLSTHLCVCLCPILAHGLPRGGMAFGRASSVSYC